MIMVLAPHKTVKQQHDQALQQQQRDKAAVAAESGDSTQVDNAPQTTDRTDSQAAGQA
jgi:hypothetical protein